MILRAACAALVLSAAACSSSGGAVSAPSPSVAAVPVLPRGVTCGHFADAGEADREAWSARLLGGLEATGEIAPVVDPASFLPDFAGNVVKLCADSLRSDAAEPIASSLAVQSLGS